MGRPKTTPLPPQGLTSGQVVSLASKSLSHRTQSRRQRLSRSPITPYRSIIKTTVKLGSRPRLDCATVLTTARSMQSKLASNLEAMEYAIDQAAIRLAEENPLPMRKRLVRFVYSQFFSSNPIVALPDEDPRWTQIMKLNDHFLPRSRSTPDFHVLQARSPIELNLALLFDCAFETRAQLQTVHDFQCDFVRFMPVELHDQDLMSMFWARGARAY